MAETLFLRVLSYDDKASALAAALAALHRGHSSTKIYSVCTDSFSKILLANSDSGTFRPTHGRFRPDKQKTIPTSVRKSAISGELSPRKLVCQQYL